MGTKFLFFEKNDDVATPKELYDDLDKIYQFDFDPCPLHPTYNGLAIEWGERNFVNPPYSNIVNWIAKGIKEMEKGKLSVFLITARTNSKYWFEYVFPNATNVVFLEKKVKFGTYEKPMPIPIVLVEFDPKKFKIFDAGQFGGIQSFSLSNSRKKT